MRTTKLLAGAAALGVVVTAGIALAAGNALAKPSSPSSRSLPPLTSTVQLDLPRYMGRWWVIAHTPYFAEKGKLAAADIYVLRADGKIDNVYEYRTKFGGEAKTMRAVGTVKPGTNGTQWKIAFFGGLLRADYLVLEVAPDYSWALIGQPSRKLAWVFAREQRMDDATLARLLAKFPAYGYDPARLKRVPQFPDQQ